MKQFTQEEANKIFDTDLGQQLDVIYVTSDNRVFIRYEEALLNTKGELDKDTKPLEDKFIQEFYSEL
jgi:hypothetical protein